LTLCNRLCSSVYGINKDEVGLRIRQGLQNFQGITYVQGDLKARGAAIEEILSDPGMISIMLDGQDLTFMGRTSAMARAE